MAQLPRGRRVLHGRDGPTEAREREKRAPRSRAEALQGVMANSWRVFKFGGSSVADAACMRRVADIIEREPAGPLAVILSASKGVTDGLLDLVSAAERQEPTAPVLAALRQRHMAMATEICTPEDV